MIYFCVLCGDYLFLTLNFDLLDCPQRPEDSSFVVDEEIFELGSTLKNGEILIIKRAKGYEKQERMCCSRCGIAVAYHQSGKYLYIFNDSITSKSTTFKDMQ